MAETITLASPAGAEAWDAARAICREYVQSLELDLPIPDIDAELAGMNQYYAPPHGLMLLAHVDGALAACGAFRRLPRYDAGTASEMKRVYVRPAFRGLGLGRQLVVALMEQAAKAGCSSMYLDTMEKLEAARSLYASLGFVEIPPYWRNPLPKVRYFRADLASRPWCVVTSKQS
jgi:putative acetyltransferase